MSDFQYDKNLQSLKKNNIPYLTKPKKSIPSFKNSCPYYVGDSAEMLYVTYHYLEKEDFQKGLADLLETKLSHYLKSQKKRLTIENYPNINFYYDTNLTKETKNFDRLFLRDPYFFDTSKIEINIDIKENTLLIDSYQRLRKESRLVVKKSYTNKKIEDAHKKKRIRTERPSIYYPKITNLYTQKLPEKTIQKILQEEENKSEPAFLKYKILQDIFRSKKNIDLVRKINTQELGRRYDSQILIPYTKKHYPSQFDVFEKIQSQKQISKNENGFFQGKKSKKNSYEDFLIILEKICTAYNLEIFISVHKEILDLIIKSNTLNEDQISSLKEKIKDFFKRNKIKNPKCVYRKKNIPLLENAKIKKIIEEEYSLIDCLVKPKQKSAHERLVFKQDLKKDNLLI